MSTGSPAILRIPLILLALANLAILGMRLRPWPDIFNLPGNGTTGFDPAISLVAYVFFFYWIGGNRGEEMRKGLTIGTGFGFLAGLVLVAEVLLSQRPGAHLGLVAIGMYCFAGILWGVAGMRATGHAGNATIGLVSGAWSAMVSCIMACTAVLATLNLDASVPLSTDPWKQYEGLAVGNPTTQLLVHSLLTATGFLLIGPLVGGAAGFLFGMLGQAD
jgi:hypothetical protein